MVGVVGVAVVVVVVVWAEGDRRHSGGRTVPGKQAVPAGAPIGAMWEAGRGQAQRLMSCSPPRKRLFFFYYHH